MEPRIPRDQSRPFDAHPRSLRELAAYLKADLRRYLATGASSSLKVILSTQGFWAVASLRWLTYLYVRFRRIPIVGPIVAIYATIHFKLIQIITGISLPISVSIGPGLYIGHMDAIVVSGDAVIGKNCNLATQVVIGIGERNGLLGVPRIGDRVFVGPGAKILGPVAIGNDVAIGANAVVVDDLPDRAVAVGVPARIVGYHGSFKYIHYYGMEQDPERVKSLARVTPAQDQRSHSSDSASRNA